MKYLALACALLLGSCARHSPHTAAPKSEPIGTIQPPADKEFVRINSPNPAENGPSRQLDSVVVVPRRTVLDKLLGRKPASKVASSLPVTVGKKSTVSVYYGPATVSTTTVGKKATAATAEGATATVTGKKSGPAVIASDSSTLNAILGGGNLAAVNGNDNELEQKAEVAPKQSFLDKLKPYGMLLGTAAAVAALIYFWPWLVALWRRRPKNDTTA